MDIIILFTIFTLIPLIGSGEINVFAQNNISQIEYNEGDIQIAIQEDNETTGNITRGLVGVANGTGNAAGNITEGLGDAVNETGEALSNSTKDTIEGINDVFNGSNL